MTTEPQFYLRQLKAGRDFGVGDPVATGMENFVYLVGDRVRRECVVIDPAWDVAGILGETQRFFRRTEVAPGNSMRAALAESEAPIAFALWLRSEGWRWPSDPEAFLDQDDVSVLAAMRTSNNVHARAILYRERFTLAFETEEHTKPEELERYRRLLPCFKERFGASILVDHSAKNPHRLGESGVLVRRFDGTLATVAEVSDFIAHMSKIQTYRVYAERSRKEEVAAAIRQA